MKLLHKVKLAAYLLPLGLIGACGGGGDSQADLQRACDGGIQASCEFVEQPTGGDNSVFAIRPTALTIGDCNTNIPFFFTGGTPPFTVLTTDNLIVPVSAALPLGAEHYFTASIGAFGIDPETGAGREDEITLSVLDSQSRIVTSKLNVERGHVRCPNDLLFTASPASGNMRVSEIVAFQLTNGAGDYAFQFSTPGIIRVADFGPGFVSVQAVSAGTALLTVTNIADGQRVNITIRVIQ